MRIIFTLISLICTISIYAQNITGTVKDNKTDEPLIGASVQIKKSPKGGVTDANGRFNVPAKIGDVLVIRYTGYETKELAVSSITDLVITLNSSSEQLKEAIVVGYGTKSRRDITGSIASISTLIYYFIVISLYNNIY